MQQEDLNTHKAPRRIWHLAEKHRGRPTSVPNSGMWRDFTRQVKSQPTDLPVLHHQQDEERATIHPFPLLASWKGMAVQREYPGPDLTL